MRPPAALLLVPLLLLPACLLNALTGGAPCRNDDDCDTTTKSCQAGRCQLRCTSLDGCPTREVCMQGRCTAPERLGSNSMEVAACSSCQVDDHAAHDFTTTSNPNGRWTYAAAPSPGAAAVSMVNVSSDGTVDAWRSSRDQTGAAVLHNGGTVTQVTLRSGPIAPGVLAMHPAGNELAVLQWKAPQAGTWRITVILRGSSRFDAGPSTSDMAVLNLYAGGVFVAAAGINTHGLEGDALVALDLDLSAGETVNAMLASVDNKAPLSALWFEMAASLP